MPNKIKKNKERIKLNDKIYEFSGLVYINNNVLNYLKHNSKFLYKKFYNKNLSYLIKHLIRKFSFNYCIDGNVKECNNYEDYLNFIFYQRPCFKES